jgi:glycosyltransferase involved in cell wall biosynthesis
MPRLLYLIPEDWYFLLHRTEIARAAGAAGYDVHVATHAGPKAAAIAAEGFHLHGLESWRGSFNPLRLLAAVRAVRRIYRASRPDVVHHVTLSAVVIGGLAARGLGIACVNSVVGMGSLFSSQGLKVRVLRALLSKLLPFLLNRAGSVLTVENSDDAADFIALGVRPEQTMVIVGAAFDLDATPVLAEPAEPVTIAYVGRMIAEKGVRDLVAAHQRLAGTGRTYRLWLVGEPDAGNPNAISAAELAAWSKLPQVEWLGHRADIQAIWAGAHIAALPTLYREGLPQSLIEAAAYGRPLIATDAPGCRDIVRHGLNGLLVPPSDPEALAVAIDTLAQDRELRRRFGAAGRELVENQFAGRKAVAATLRLYERVLRQDPQGGLQ